MVYFSNTAQFFPPLTFVSLIQNRLHNKLTFIHHPKPQLTQVSLQPTSKAATTSSGGNGNYTSEVKSDSSCSSGSANGFLFRDSDSPKKGKVSSSDGNDMSSSSSVVVPRERLLPSIYDDDAQSGSPSGVFEKKDLAFQSSFKKNFPMSRDRSRYGLSFYGMF